MKKVIRIYIVVVVLGAFLGWWLGGGEEPSSASIRPVSQNPAQQQNASAVSKVMKEAASVTQASREPASSQGDLASLNDMSRALFLFSRPATGLKALVDYLEDTRQEPLVVRDANAYTGEMAIVRTRAPLPSTRYFHAQYFGDERGEGFLQHMSFEFKPGPTAMDDAIQSVQKSFGLGAPKVRRANYAQWSLKEGYIVWIKKMDAGDLKDDPFNAYTSADAGTIRVAIEAEIH